MSYFRDVPSTADNELRKEVPDTFRRHIFSTRKFRAPRRYILALFLFLLLIIKKWRNVNVLFMITAAIALDIGREKNHSLGTWTVYDLDKFTTVTFVVNLLAQIPGTVLIFTVGSHKYLLTSAVVTSILHMLTPTVLKHHSVSLIIVLIGKVLFEASVFTAVISMWKDWATISERTKLIAFSMAGLFIEYASSIHYGTFFNFFTSDKSFYFSGIAGLVWALFWYNITSDTPQNDPLISEKELLYLENNIPSDLQEKIRLKDVPWKSILTSKPVAILCIIFFKMACSETVIRFGSFLFLLHLEPYNISSIFIVFASVFSIVIPCSAILADYMINKFRARTLLIKKGFLCGGFVLQCLFMFGTLAPSNYTKAICFMISYIIYAASVPGFITLALDLSPRYVTIIAGMAYTSYFVVPICMKYIIEGTVSFYHVSSVCWLVLVDGIFSMMSVVLFAIWGEADEQLWSLTFFRNSKPSGCVSYPEPNDMDDGMLQPEAI